MLNVDNGNSGWTGSLEYLGRALHHTLRVTGYIVDDTDLEIHDNHRGLVPIQSLWLRHFVSTSPSYLIRNENQSWGSVRNWVYGLGGGLNLPSREAGLVRPSLFNKIQQAPQRGVRSPKSLL